MFSNSEQMLVIVFICRIIQKKSSYNLMYLHCLLVLCGCLIDAPFSPFHVCFFKCSLNIRAKALIFELNVYSTFMEFKYESSSPHNE